MFNILIRHQNPYITHHHYDLIFKKYTINIKEGNQMKTEVTKKILKGIKKSSDKQISNTIDGRCLFLCYQPKIPKNIRDKVKY